MQHLIVSIVATAIVSYLIGSMNSALTLMKIIYHQDIREYGSKNAGLTNVLRVYGKKAALITLVTDLAKGIIAVLLSRLIFTLASPEITDLRFVGFIASLFAVLGHIFPVYYKFKGGKGILIAATTLLVTDPVVFAIVIPLFAILVAITRYVSLSSIITASVYPFAVLITEYLRGYPQNIVLINTGLVAVICFFLIFMHRPNIKRLREGTENKFSFGSKKEK